VLGIKVSSDEKAGNRKTPTRKLRAVAKEIIAPSNQKNLEISVQETANKGRKKQTPTKKLQNMDCSRIPGQPSKFIPISSELSRKFVLKNAILL
jgi:hypothetical protein